MPDIATAIAIIGAGLLVGGKLLKKEDPPLEPGEPYETTVARNADSLGYERVKEGEELNPGQSQPVTENGVHVGDVVQTTDGTLIYQNAQTGQITTATEGEIEIESQAITSPKSAVGIAPVVKGNINLPIKKSNPKGPAFAHVKPKKPIQNTLLNKRLVSAARAGVAFRM